MAEIAVLAFISFLAVTSTGICIERIISYFRANKEFEEKKLQCDECKKLSNHLYYGYESKFDGRYPILYFDYHINGTPAYTLFRHCTKCREKFDRNFHRTSVEKEKETEIKPLIDALKYEVFHFETGEKIGEIDLNDPAQEIKLCLTKSSSKC